MEKKVEKELTYLFWDRKLNEKDIKKQLKNLSGMKRDQLIAWILREAAFKDVWLFLTPRQVYDTLPRIQSNLGRWQGFWNYITETWHELGKI